MMRLRLSEGAALAGGIAAAVALIAFTWVATLLATSNQRVAAEARIAAVVANQAEMLADQVQFELREVDQTLHVLARLWETDPDTFRLLSWRNDLRVVNAISPDLFLTDEHGIVRDSTVPDAIGRDLADRDYFRALAERFFDDGRMFVSPSTVGGLARQWHMNLARPLHHPDGSFAGVLVAALRLNVVNRFYRTGNIGSHGVVAIVGLEQGDLRFAVGVNPIDPGTSIAASDMFGAMRADPNTVWVGRTALDGVERVHGFHRVAEREMAVVVALDRGEAMEPTEWWVFAARLFAGGITALVLLLAASLVQAIRTARRHRETLSHEHAVLASANTELELTRTRADEKSLQLDGLLAAMSEGAAVFDAEMQLLQWNVRFPELARIPSGILRIGQPIEEVLRALNDAELPGPLDAEAEVTRQAAVLRGGRDVVAVASRLPDGGLVRLRRRRLPDGNSVVLCGRQDPGGAGTSPRADEAPQTAPASEDPARLYQPRLDELRVRLPADALASWVEACLSELADRLALLRRGTKAEAADKVFAYAQAMAETAAECGLAGLEVRLRTLAEAIRQAPGSAAALTEGLPTEFARAAVALRRAFHIEMA